MLLVHDIGEIDAGDTMVFVEGGWEQRKAAEFAVRHPHLRPFARCTVRSLPGPLAGI